jgi:non-homologous end joining protein Ku
MRPSSPAKANSRQRAKGEYLQIEPEELEAIAIESKRTMGIDGFVPPQGNR